MDVLPTGRYNPSLADITLRRTLPMQTLQTDRKELLY